MKKQHLGPSDLFSPTLQISMQLEGERTDSTQRPDAPAPPGHFLRPDPDILIFNGKSLRVHLENIGYNWVVRLHDFLKFHDWKDWLSSYRGDGRRPFHPSLMFGLILYGIIKQQYSLRNLEELALTHVACMYLTGGLQPDHATLGRFLTRHERILSGPEFENFTKRILSLLKLPPSTVVAVDGTTIEAVSSRFSTLKEEAAATNLNEAKLAAEREPNKENAEEDVIKAEKIHNEVVKRNKARKGEKKKISAQVSPNELDAVVSPLKHGGFAPAYKPVVMADENGFILGQDVHPSCESECLVPILDQAILTTGTIPEEILLDGGFHNPLKWNECLERGSSVLCAKGGGTSSHKKSSGDVIPKSKFHYNEKEDTYTCPAGKTLYPGSAENLSNGSHFRRFVTSKGTCLNCHLLNSCTKSKIDRSIKRYERDDLVEIMEEVLKHPGAQAMLKRRSGMVEPIFANLKERLGLKRFSRLGLEKVRLEFGLFCLAYNVKKALKLGLMGEKADSRNKGVNHGVNSRVKGFLGRLLHWVLGGQLTHLALT